MTAGTEPPSPRRLRQAREAGLFPVSGVCLRVAAWLGVAAGVPSAIQVLAAGIRVALERSALHCSPREQLGEVSRLLLRGTVGALGTGAACVLVVGLWQTGGQWVPNRWLSKGSRLAPPRTGLPRELQGQWFFGLVAGAGVVLVWGGLLVWGGAPWLLACCSWLDHPRAGLDPLIHVLGRTAAGLASVAVVVAAIDWVLKRQGFRRGLRMTRTELNRERRDSEGAPERRLSEHKQRQELLRARVRSPQEGVHPPPPSVAPATRRQ